MSPTSRAARGSPRPTAATGSRPARDPERERADAVNSRHLTTTSRRTRAEVHRLAVARTTRMPTAMRPSVLPWCGPSSTARRGTRRAAQSATDDSMMATSDQNPVPEAAQDPPAARTRHVISKPSISVAPTRRHQPASLQPCHSGLRKRAARPGWRSGRVSGDVFSPPVARVIRFPWASSEASSPPHAMSSGTSVTSVAANRASGARPPYPAPARSPVRAPLAPAGSPDPARTAAVGRRSPRSAAPRAPSRR